MQKSDKNLQRAILCWYGKNRRDLPWRRSRDPYRILVSEIMLQQTQVDRVIPKYEAFLERFPTVEALGAAPSSEVIKMWQGLGYNRRALALKRAAEIIAKTGWPDTLEAMCELPGIGRYTAGAVLSFAFGKRVPALDVNGFRIFRRLFFGAGPKLNEVKEKEISERAETLLPPDPAEWHQSLMDFGALVCRANPKCAECPLRSICPSKSSFDAGWTEVRRGSKPVRFKDSARYVRGRIMDILRESRARKAAILRPLEALGVQKERVEDALASLERDGLLEKRGNVYCLPR